MNKDLQAIFEIIQDAQAFTEEVKEKLVQSVKKVDKELEIVNFKLDRTEKVKRTTAILLEETIEELEQKRKAVEETNVALNQSLQDLKAAQTQLIHVEKMASLGELTAGIAHEIQNPLNFVNNFAELSIELIDEMRQELGVGGLQSAVGGQRSAVSGQESAVSGQRSAVGSQQSAIEIIDDIRQNLDKILHHGKRADAIVKGMLQHSRTSRGQKELTDLNALADEYLRLAYHGLRAKDKTFNADFRLEADENLPKVNVVPQDIGRVLLNLINNAFYAVSTRKLSGSEPVSNLSGSTNLTGLNYTPTVTVSTKNFGDHIEIRVRDNGDGISNEIKKKIFQPFFTTKPTGEGTGLGLSLSYDIITKGHGGDIRVDSKAGEGTELIILLPIN